MRFISKNANLRIVLKPGIPADALGHPTVPGLHVRFEDGVRIENDTEIIRMLMAHPGFNSDFILADNIQDPFLRTSSEPEHDITEIQFGHVGKSLNPRPAVTITPEIKKALEKMALEMAKEMAKEMAPMMALELVKKLKQDVENKDETPVIIKAKKGRPPKAPAKAVEEGVGLES